VEYHNWVCEGTLSYILALKQAGGHPAKQFNEIDNFDNVYCVQNLMNGHVEINIYSKEEAKEVFKDVDHFFNYHNSVYSTYNKIGLFIAVCDTELWSDVCQMLFKENYFDEDVIYDDEEEGEEI